MAQTSIFNKVAIAVGAEASLPTVPNLGSNVASWSGYSTIGSIQTASDDADLGDESISMAELVSEVDVKPPRSLTREDVILLSAAIDEFTFTAYDASEALLTLDSRASVVSNDLQFGSTRTYRTVIVEINGFSYIYFPNCMVRLTTVDGGFGEDGVVKTQFTVRPVATSTYKAGFVWRFYPAA